MRASVLGTATLIAGLIAIAGCSSPTGSHAAGRVTRTPSPGGVSAAAMYQTPEQATLSWFYAINHKDAAAAVAHVDPAEAEMMNWYGGASNWPTFSALHCRQVSATATSAQVYCTFNESLTEAVGQPDNFWTVQLDRQSDGRWLITSYGTG